ncbi:MAG: crotonase/enoyl-CoA hydratase family protein [Candidatus Binatia bacterium]
MDAASEVLRVERDGHVATLWLDDPARRNAMGPAFWEALPRLFAELSDDPAVRVVLIAAQGPHFTVGLDLKAFGSTFVAGGDTGSDSEAARRTRLRRMVKRMQGAINAVADCPKPVIAAVHGYCIGGGIDLITACDIRLAAADARFSVRETKIAIVADVGTLQRLPGIVGDGHVAELCFTGKDIPAARAKEIGLVNDVHPDTEALWASARALAAEIAANSPLAVQGTKAVLRKRREREIADGLDYVALWNSAFLQSNDLGEAMAAFLEKRPPKFRGE